MSLPYLTAKDKCYELSTPPGGKLKCEVQGEDTVCTVKCKRKERFVIDSGSEYSTKCGPNTKYEWEHVLKNVTLPACSCKYLALLSLSSIYTHFNTLKKKLYENIVEKGEIAQNEQLHLFPQCFLCNLYLKIL